MTSTDPVTLEILANGFASVAEEMGASLIRSSYSPIIREMLDCSCAVFDRHGRLLAQAEHIPAQLGLMEFALRHTLAELPPHTLSEGDLLLMNHPYHGGSHTPDLQTYMPIFQGGQIMAYAGTVAHHIDVGGRVPCTEGIDNTEIYQEGLLLAPLKLYDRGVLNDAVYNIIRDAVRDPVATLGDLRAQVSACHKGAQRFAELAEHYGAETLTHYADQLMLYTERRVRDEIATWPDGVYEAEGFMDDDGVERDKPVRLHARVVVDGDEVTVDLTGCAPQVRGAINLPHASTHAAVYFALKSFVGSGIPQNAGATRPITILTRPGTIVQPRSPAPVSVRHITCQRLTDVLLAALSQALPDRAIAACHVSFPTFGFGGYDASRERNALITDILGGGYGAMPGADGLDAVDTYTSNCGILPAEVAELEYPWRIVRTELVPDSGGAGTYRGGLGLRRDYLLLADEAFGNYYVEQTNPAFAPRGLNGGFPGAAALAGLGEGGEYSFVQIPAKAVLALRRNDRLVLIGAGGGGYGDPLQRDAALVEADVRDGVVSRQVARDQYGVIVDDDGRLDVEATDILRASMRRSQPWRG